MWYFQDMFLPKLGVWDRSSNTFCRKVNPLIETLIRCHCISYLHHEYIKDSMDLVKYLFKTLVSGYKINQVI